MLSLFLFTLLSLFIFYVLGSHVSKLFTYPMNRFDQIFLGLVAANTLASALSLFSPINSKILLGIPAFCILSFIIFKEPWEQLTKKTLRKKNILFFSLPFILISFILSLAPQNSYDSGLYHVQAIKWIQEYSVIPGLGNLHGRLGFNPNVFSLNALTSLKIFFDQKIYSLNFTIYVILIFYYVDLLYAISKKQGFSNLLFLYLVIFYETLKLYSTLSSPTPDFVAISLTFYVFSRIVDFGQRNEMQNFKFFIPIGILIVYLVTVKLSTIPLLVLPLFLLLNKRPHKKIIIKSLLLASVVVTPWVLRNIVLTGYLIFPVTSLDLFDFEWKVPMQKVETLQDQIRGWARMPGPGHMTFAKLEFGEWFPFWWERVGKLNKFLLIGSFFAPGLLLVRQIIQQQKIKAEYYAVTLTSLFGIIFWLLTAPDFRFGRAFVVVAFLSPILFLPFSYKSKTKFLLPIILLLLTLQFYRITYLNNKDFFLSLPFNTVYQKDQQPPLLKYKTISKGNIKIFVPKYGDRCFDHDLPCADPYNRLDLIQIRKGSLEYGFRPLPK